MAKKKKNFQLEIRLGLALIVLVLLTLNLASHYTLYRVRQSVEVQTRDELYEAAVRAANIIQRQGMDAVGSKAFEDVKLEYSLKRLTLLDWNLRRIKNAQDHQQMDAALLALDSDLTTEALLPLLINQPVFHHKYGGKNSIVLFPTGEGEDGRIIAVAKPTPLLSVLENAGKILVYAGLLGIVVIIYTTLKFSRYVIMPFKKLSENAVNSGHLDKSGGEDVSRLIQFYERMITDLRQKEKELRRLNEIVTRRADDLEVYNNYVLGSINTGVVTLDNDQSISTLNREAERIFQKNADELTGINYAEVFAGFTELTAKLERFFEDNEPVGNHQVVISGKDNSDLILSVSISGLSDSKGNKIGTWIILSDQSEFISMREELDLKTRMATLGEMSGGLAHQLRNSIAAIVGFARLSSKRSDNNELVKRNLKYLLDESLEAESLVARFLDFARPLELCPETFDLDELLTVLIASLEDKYPMVAIGFEMDDISDAELKGDTLLLKQAIGNILDNACKAAGDDNGNVMVSAKHEGNYVDIIIEDNGAGIPEKYHDKIFTPFFSGAPSGTGLGLPLARKIINLHEGSLRFETSAGNGTSFIINLPRVITAEEKTPSDKESAITS